MQWQSRQILGRQTQKCGRDADESKGALGFVMMMMSYSAGAPTATRWLRKELWKKGIKVSYFDNDTVNKKEKGDRPFWSPYTMINAVLTQDETGAGTARELQMGRVELNIVWSMGTGRDKISITVPLMVKPKDMPNSMALRRWSEAPVSEVAKLTKEVYGLEVRGMTRQSFEQWARQHDLEDPQVNAPKFQALAREELQLAIDHYFSEGGPGKEEGAKHGTPKILLFEMGRLENRQYDCKTFQVYCPEDKDVMMIDAALNSGQADKIDKKFVWVGLEVLELCDVETRTWGFQTTTFKTGWWQGKIVGRREPLLPKIHLMQAKTDQHRLKKELMAPLMEPISTSVRVPGLQQDLTPYQAQKVLEQHLHSRLNGAVDNWLSHSWETQQNLTKQLQLNEAEQAKSKSMQEEIDSLKITVSELMARVREGAGGGEGGGDRMDMEGGAA